MTIFIVSDTHFGHANILNFKQENGDPVRLFESVEEMDELMVKNWNDVVGETDHVYHLGDVYFGQGWKHISRLKGKKRLVLGNHDNPLDQNLYRHFKKMMVWRDFKEYDCILSHVPIHEASLFKRSKNLHGHIHNDGHRGLIDDPRYINCCVEVRNYTPIPIEELVK